MKISMRLIVVILGFFILATTAFAYPTAEKIKELHSIVAYVIGYKMGVELNKTDPKNDPDFNRSKFIEGFSAAWDQEKLSPSLQKTLQIMMLGELNKIPANINNDQFSYMVGYYSFRQIYKGDPYIRKNNKLKSVLKGLRDGFENKKIPNNIAQFYFKNNTFSHASKEKIGYAIGYTEGRYLALADIKKKNIDVQCYITGLKDAMNNKPLSFWMKLKVKEIRLRGLNNISKKEYSGNSNNYCYAAGYVVEDSLLKSMANKYQLNLSNVTKGFIDGMHAAPLDAGTSELVKYFKKFLSY